MRNDRLIRVVAIVLLVALLLSFGAAAIAQEGDDGGGASTGDIIPDPNSGEAPEEAGDRGGTLQVGLLVLVGVVIAGMAVYVARRSKPARELRALRAAEERRSRKGGGQPTQASRPPGNPDR